MFVCFEMKLMSSFSCESEECAVLLKILFWSGNGGGGGGGGAGQPVS